MHRSGEMRIRNMKLKKKLIKIKAEKNWDVDKKQKQKKKLKPGGEGEKKYDNLCGLGKGFLKVARPRVSKQFFGQ